MDGGSMASVADNERRLIGELTAWWPSLPFLAFGLWQVWANLSYSGSLWLSDNEVNGFYLSVMYIFSGFANAVALVFAALYAKRRPEIFAASNRWVMGGGILAGIGCLIIVLVGPFYLGAVTANTSPFFFGGAMLSGIGTSVIALRCGALFSLVPPRRILVYAAQGELLGTFVYFVVMAAPSWSPIEHGPTLVGILAFVLLPVLAAALACVRPPQTAGLIEFHGNDRHETALRGLPRAFWGFCAFMLVITFAAGLLRGAVVTTHALAATVEGNDILMILRVFTSIAFTLYAVRTEGRPSSIGKLCSMLAVIAATVTACAAAFGGLNNELSLVIYFCGEVFSFLVWCLLSFISVQRCISPIVVFGIGYGVFMAGNALGWLCGTVIVPLIPVGSTATIAFLVLAGVMLAVSQALFSPRDYDRLFMRQDEEELSIDDLFDIERRVAEATSDGNREKRGRFSRAIEGLAAEYGLSAREVEVLRCLAMGYGSDRMAQTMGVKVNTARAHTHNVYVKLDVHSRDELMKLVDDAVAQA